MFPGYKSPVDHRAAMSNNGGRISSQESPASPEASRAAETNGGHSRYKALSPTMAITPAVSVVIPVKNEARNIPMVLNSLPEWVNDVVLVDGRSVDDTVAVAQRCRPDIKVV